MFKISRIAGRNNGYLIGPDEMMHQVYPAIGHYACKLIQSGNERLVLAAILGDGALMLPHVRSAVQEKTGYIAPFVLVDATEHRDDLALKKPIDTMARNIPLQFSEGLTSVDGLVVLLLDSVLETGRTARAALDVLHEYGRPSEVRLAVIYDRLGRELPIALSLRDFFYRREILPPEIAAKLEDVGDGYQAMVSRPRSR